LPSQDIIKSATDKHQSTFLSSSPYLCLTSIQKTTDKKLLW